MGEMKIELILDAKPINKIPYELAHKYKYIVKNEIDNMFKASIIYPIDQSKWVSPMVVNLRNKTLKSLEYV